MPSYPESGIKLVADVGDYNSAMDEAIAKAQEFDSIGDLSMSITVDADTSEAESALEDLPLSDETVDFTVDATVTGDEIPVDGETIDADLNVEETDTAKETLSAVNTLKNLKVIETVWNIAGTAVDIFRQFTSFAVTPMLDLDTAIARVNATTGNAIPNARELIQEIFYNDLGESIGQVGEMITKAQALGLPVKDAATAALTFTKTWTDQDPSTTITTLGTLLKTNLVDNMQDAADLMTVFFQQGGNKGGDALQVVNANAQSWKDMGLNAQEALSTISSLLQGNVDNASDAAKMIQTLDDNLTTAAANASSPQAQLLKQMGLENPKDKGQAMGADFIDGFAAAFATMPSDKQDLISSTFMGKGGKKFTGAIEGMTASSDLFANAKDQAKIAAEEIDNSLQGAITDFLKMAEQKVTEWLSSAAIDLPGKITKLKEGLQAAMDELAKGGTLSDALTVALKPIGFDDEFQGLESALGNFVIGILQAVAQLQDLTGHGTEAAGTRLTIADLSQKQLAFDLKIGNPDQLASDIAVAVARGVTPKDITASVSTAVSELVKNGAIEQAQALLDEFSKNAPNLQVDYSKSGLDISEAQFALKEGGDRLQQAIDKGIVIDVNPNLTPEAKAVLQDQIDDALNDLNPTMTEAQKSITDSTKPLIDMANSTTDVTKKVTDAKPKLDNLAQGVDKMGGVSKRTTTAVTDTSVSIEDVGLSAMVATVQMNSFGNQIDIVAAKLNSALGTADNVAQQNNNNNTDTNIPNSNPDAPAGPSLTSNDSSGFGARGIMSALNGYVPGANFNSHGGISNTINNVNVVPNIATADALGYRQAAQLRGMSNK